MEMTQFASQRARAFSFDNFETENKENCAKIFSSYCKKGIHQTFSWSALLYMRLVVPLEF